MAIRGWFNFEGTHHYVLKNRTFLCDATKHYDGYKRDLFKENPDSIMAVTKNFCPECSKLYRDAMAIEDMRISGVSEKPTTIKTLDNRDFINEINNSKREALDNLVEQVSRIHPANVPFVAVEDNLRVVELETREKASEMLDILNGRINPS